MASIAKIKTSGVRAVFNHANRTEADGHTHSNENIDLSRTQKNYRIKLGEFEDWQKRLDDVFYVKRKDGVTFAEAVVTLPKDVNEKDERSFFQSCYEFFADDFGEQNVIYAVVHKDEIQPHMHLGFVPVVKGDVNELYSNALNKRNHLETWKEKHGGEYPQERICVGKVITRKYLWDLHERLNEKVDRDLGYHVSVINGATVHGNKSILELKVKTLQEKKDKLEKSLSVIQTDAKAVKESLARTGVKPEQFELYPLLQKIEALQEQNRILMDIIARNNCKYKVGELKQDIKPIKSMTVSTFEGSYVDEYENIPDNTVMIIELPKGRDSPQQKAIASDYDLRQTVSFAKNSREDIKAKRSRVADRWFVTIKTDENEQNTINNLLALERILREIADIKSKRIYMDRMESDRYDLAKSILISHDYTASYFEKKSVLDKFIEEKKQEEKELQK